MGQCQSSRRNQGQGAAPAASPGGAPPQTNAATSPLLTNSDADGSAAAGVHRRATAGAVLAAAPALPRQRQAAFAAQAAPGPMHAVQAPAFSRADMRQHACARAGQTAANTYGQVLHPFSQALRERYPQCIASTRSRDPAVIVHGQAARRSEKTHDDVMVQGCDGRIRRFPVDRGTSFLVRNGWPDGSLLCLGRTFISQIGMLYDAHKDAVSESIGGYVIDADTQRLVYKVGDAPVRSLRADIDVFPLPGAKWMVPQTEFRGCTFACEKMLLLEGRSAAEATALIRDFDPHDYRRKVGDVAAALRASSRRLPEVLSKTLTSDAWIALLRKCLARHGPGILNVDGHARILDAIDTTVDGHVFTMRDPFTGSFLKIKDHEQFWSPATTLNLQEGDTVRPTDRRALRNLSAIFLTQTAAPDQAPG